MGFDVKTDDVRGLEAASGQAYEHAITALLGAQAASEVIIGLTDFSGAAATSAKEYLCDVHQALTAGFTAAITEFQEQLMIYRDDLQNIDSDEHGEFNEQGLEEVESEHKKAAQQFEQIDAKAKSIIASVDDIICGSGPNGGAEITESIGNLIWQARTTRESVGALEHSHLHDLDKVAQTISKLRALMDQIPTRGTAVTTWHGGAAFRSSEAYGALMKLGSELTSEQEGRGELFAGIRDREKMRDNQLLAEEKTDSGWQELIGGVIAVVGSAICIVGSGGSAIPIVLGVASMVLGASDIIEGAGNVQLGEKGDLTHQAVNPIAEKFFGGNKELYHNVEGIVFFAQAGEPLVGGVRGLISIRGAAGMDGRESLWEFSKVGGRAGSLGVDPPRLPELKVKFELNKNPAVEFDRQLGAQEEGLNDLTVQEFLDNRERYLTEGRDDSFQHSARAAARAKRIADLRAAGASREEAERQADDWLHSQAALHNPDQVAGGYASNIGGLGDSSVNSSIGAQWRTRVGSMDKEIRKLAEGMSPEQRASTYLNVRLVR